MAVWLDATDFSGSAFETTSEPEASGAQCLRSIGSSSPKSNAASISFDCADRTYEIYARICPDSWNGDTVQYRLDAGDWLAQEKIKPPSRFQWHGVALTNPPTHQVDLAEDHHTLEIAWGTDNVLLDELFVTSDVTVVGAYGESNNQ